jgi:acetyl-CoA acetyltransferase family protein
VARGKADGALHDVHPVELLAKVLDEVAKRSNVPKVEVEDVIGGIVSPLNEQGANVPRLAALMAGFPNTTAGVQLNRMCGSSQQAVHFAAQAIASGDMDCVIACGVEMMSVVPMGSDSNLMSGNAPIGAKMPFKVMHQGQSAELIAEKWQLTRPELDKLAGGSHEKADAAIKKGYFKREILPIKVKKADGSEVTFSVDEGVRVPVDYDRMAKLPTPFKKNGKISAANASQISDGASAVLLVSEAKLKQLKLTPRAKVITRVVVGSDPEYMLDGVIPATRQALKKAGLTKDQIDVFEINEAFGSVVLAWMKDIQPDPAKVNPNGGAQAHGHPLGATGTILMTKLLHELERTGGRYGLQTMCIGFGMATATIIENMNPKVKAKL